MAQAVQAASTLPPDFHRPTWQGLWDGAAPGQGPGEPGDFLRGWQKEATSLTDEAAHNTLFSDLDLASRALLLSQAGPQVGRALHVLPTGAELRLPSDRLRIVLLRRLRMPLPAAARACRCGRPADALGDRVTACPTSGVLRTRAVPLERAVARVCREAGGRVAMHVRVAEMNVDVPVSDARCIEILASLPVWHGAQVAIDTTLVSPIGRDGQPRGRSAAREAGGVLEQAARRKRETTYPELLAARRCRLVVFGVKVGGRWNGEPSTSAGPALLPLRRRALAATLAGLPGAGLDALDGTAPRRPHASARLSKPAGCRCGPADGPRAVAARRRGRLLRPCRRKRFTLLARKPTCLTLAARKKVRQKKHKFRNSIAERANHKTKCSPTKQASDRPRKNCTTN